MLRSFPHAGLIAALVAATVLLTVASPSSAKTATNPIAVYHTLKQPSTWRTPPAPLQYFSSSTFDHLPGIGVGKIVVVFAYGPPRTNLLTGLSAIVVDVIKSARAAQTWLTHRVPKRAKFVPSARVYRWVSKQPHGYEAFIATRVGVVVVTANGGPTNPRPPRAAWAIVAKLLTFAAARAHAAQR